MPLTLLQQGRFKNVPIIFGTNKNEGSIFVPALVVVVPGMHFPPQDADLVLGRITVVFTIFPILSCTARYQSVGPIEKYYVFCDLSECEKVWHATSQAFEPCTTH